PILTSSPSDKEDHASTATTAISDTNNLQAAITSHLNKATTAQPQKDSTLQRNAVDNAERVLIQWVELSRGVKSNGDNDGSTTNNHIMMPGADVFYSVIQGYLSLPSSIRTAQQQTNDVIEECITDDCEEELAEKSQIKSLLGKRIKKGGEGELLLATNLNNNNSPPHLATRILDVMESYHEPTPEAWKCAKAALQLLNRSEDLYHETGKNKSRLPGVSSYATVMDVYKALAVNSADVVLVDSKKNSRDDAMNVWKNLRQRRLEMYRLNDPNFATDEGGRRSRYNILPGEVTKSVEDTFRYAYNLLCESSPSYADDESLELSLMDEHQKIGTFHFNQLIFDLANYPQTFSGLLAQDLLEFMVSTVSSTPKNERGSNPNVPKPTVETINGVLKAWMVTPNYHDAVARRVESVLAKLAGWQSDGTLWGITPDTVSYNTCINCWKQSGIPGAAERATEILALMEDESTNIAPDAISYCSCISAWAECAATNPRAGANAEAILTRMHSRGKENEDAPQPTTRCFNACFLLMRMGNRRVYTFNIVMKALAKSKENGAAEKASQLLRRMEQSYDKGSTLQPDIFSYNIVLDAFSRIGDSESAEKRDDVQADTSCYNALINVWAKSGERKALYRVTQILSTMEELGLQGGDESVAPNSRTYCAVLDCIARSRNFKAYNKALEVIERMEDFHAEGHESTRPCARAYSIVISTIARSRKRDKAVKAQDMLRRMESEYVKGNVAARPTVYSYNGVLNAAAFTSGDERDQEEAFRVACLTFDELRISEYLQPTHRKVSDKRIS
ncbi:pentatricopeptide repeat-containing protein, partial [Skeletonema marinoi]